MNICVGYINRHAPQSIFLQMFLSSHLLTTFIISIVYLSLLTSILTIPQTSNTIDSIKKLETEVFKGNILLATDKETHAADILVKRLSENIGEEQATKSIIFTKHITEGLEMCLLKKDISLAVVCERLFIDIYTNYYGKQSFYFPPTTDDS